MMWLFSVLHEKEICATISFGTPPLPGPVQAAAAPGPRHIRMWIVSSLLPPRASLSGRREKALTSTKLNAGNNLGLC